jgi:gamma-glutamylaminecyclotransferase
MVRVFVYGTLTDPDRVESLLDRYDLGSEATLHGLRRVEGQYPTLAPGGRTEGRLLSTPELDRLDAYEGVESGLYVRVSVPLSEGGTAECYVGDPEPLGADAAWPGEGRFEERVRSYLSGERVVIGRNE